jgi:hypothetical protein
VALVVALVTSSAALAVDDGDELPPPGDDVCAGLADEVLGLCNAFCNAQDCPAHPNKNSCVVLRRNFEQQTGQSTFPCEGEVITATPSPSRTATSIRPSATPTNTAAATVSATRRHTATPAATATRTGLPTATLTGIPAGTATATQTSSAATATATAASTATGTPAGTATQTPSEGTNPCAGLSEGAFGLCNAFCNAQDCPADPHPSCEVLRRNFAKQTGSAVFPCEENGSAATPTAAGGTEGCMGDCGGDGVVDISDLTRAILVVLGERDPSECPSVQGVGASPSVPHMVLAVRHALEGCD